MQATIDDIVKKAEGARPSGVTRNLILHNPVPAVWIVKSMAVTITAVAKEGERAGFILTRELAEWKPVEQFLLP